MLELPNGDRARIVPAVEDSFCGYSSSGCPTGMYKGYSLYIVLETGSLYAVKEA